MDTIPLDYETLRLIWWAAAGHPADRLRRDGRLRPGRRHAAALRGAHRRRAALVINIVGPVWEGNQVWLILGGGAIFAALPPLYAVSFSGFYLAMFLILFALILRPVGFKFRSKVEDKRWRAVWDWALFIGGFVPALVFGVAMGNVLLGAPFHFDDTLRIYYTGGFFGLLSPFALLCGLVSVSMLVTHGAAMLAIKTDGPVAMRARRYGSLAALATAVLFVLAGVWVAFGITGHAIVGVTDTAAASNPLFKQVASATGGWMANYRAMPWTWIFPVLGVVGALLSALLLRAGRGGCGVPGFGIGHRQHHPHRRRGGVPVPAAVLHPPVLQPDAVGFVLQPPDAVRHAGGDLPVPAPDHPLHQLGVPRAARQGEPGKPGTEPQLLLRRSHVVFLLDTRREPGGEFRHPQRHVVRNARERPHRARSERTGSQAPGGRSAR